MIGTKKQDDQIYTS